VLELAHAIRRQDRNVPLIVEMDKSLHVEAVKAAPARFHHAEIAAVQLDAMNSRSVALKTLPEFVRSKMLSWIAFKPR
jgi:hypothetical protein